MKINYLFRLTQIMLVVPMALREWINFFTDIGQYQENIQVVHKIISFPTIENANLLFNRSINSELIAKIIPITWIVVHFLAALLMTIGILVLIRSFRTNIEIYQGRKNICLFGLALAFFWYILTLGAGSMDYFFSWMQKINFNGDISGYAIPVGIALIYLYFKEH